MISMSCALRSIFLAALLGVCIVRGADRIVDHNAANYITNITQNIIVINASTKNLNVEIEQTCQRESGETYTHSTLERPINAGDFLRFEYNFLQTFAPKITIISKVELKLSLPTVAIPFTNNLFIDNLFKKDDTKAIKENPVIILGDSKKTAGFVYKPVKSAIVANSRDYRNSYGEAYTCFTVKNLRDKAVAVGFMYELSNTPNAPLVFEQPSDKQMVVIEPQKHGLFYYCSAIYTHVEDDTTERLTTTAIRGTVTCTSQDNTIIGKKVFRVSPYHQMKVERYALKGSGDKFILDKENN